MARSRLTQRRQDRLKNKETTVECPTALEILGIIMLADAEDDDEELVALLFLRLAFTEQRDRKARSGKYGRRGPYKSRKSKDFFDLMLNDFSDRWFKSWFRCESMITVFNMISF